MTAEYITKTDLKAARGWTDAAIKKFLGSEDKNSKNPVYRSASPVCLYLLERVVEAEASEEFEHWKKLSEKRRESAKKAAQTRQERERQRQIEAQQKALELHKQQQLFGEAISVVKLNIQQLPHKELVVLACEEWNKNNPEIASSNVQTRTEITPFSRFIESMNGFGRKKIPALVEQAQGYLAMYYQSRESEDSQEMRRIIVALYALCGECESLLNHMGSQHPILKQALDLKSLNHFNRKTSDEELANWVSNFIDVVEGGVETLVVQGSGKIIKIQNLINSTILKIHEAEIQTCQEELNAIAEHFQEWIPSAAFQVKQRCHQLLKEKYPYFTA
ncbi:hypothetical protein WA1_22565 [Scytonema hofmannii PCC 7110]|uniref:Uncharacterized protein n=1 Tax=Scytonema hofmannii PCC 7110 TaxID=128403 RepID=A0A139X971_9CYAN|nr:hypothetical protein [Scytonema hofmannii]KYC41251.1 hypothetical protein WA1_22565 [Scytonema hofmannii PCC 7110]